MSNDTVGALIRKAESDYTTGVTTIGKYVEFSQFENIEKIDAYLNSKHVSGQEDSMGRLKPFFNIVTGAVNIWFRATDIDRKNIRIKATKQKDFIGAFLATIHLQEWMKKDNFGQFLNDWGRSLARYGSSVLKFVEKGGKLHAEVVTWNRLISDTVDFENNPKIEKLWLTPAQLRLNKAYDQDVVEGLLNAIEARETMDGQKKDNKNDYIEVFELHGNLPLSYLEDEPDLADHELKEIYTQQMHVVSYVKSRDGKGYDDFCLLKGKEKNDPYMITHLIKEDGRSQSIGAVEHLFQAQWMVNHSIKAIRDQLDLASKIIYQTADTSFIGMNALDNIQNGDILIHKADMPLGQVNMASHDIGSLTSFKDQWQILAKEITSTPDSITGDTMPSGTAYRQVAILNQEAHSLFEIMTENKGLAIEQMMRKYIIPYLRKQMDTSEEISATLSDHNITQLDSMYVTSESIRRHNAKLAFEAMNNPISQPAQGLDIPAEENKIRGELGKMGNQRFIKPSDIPTKTWSEIFENLTWDVEVEVTPEQSEKEAILTTLTTVMQTLATNPAVLQDPNMKLLFTKILETTGAVSPIEISATPQPVQQPQQTQGASPSAVETPKVGGSNLLAK